MNIVLFEKEEINRPLSSSDYRCRHILGVLKLNKGDAFRAGIIGGSKGTARIRSADPESVSFSYVPEADGVYSLPVEIIAGHPRPQAAKRIIKDLTSIGVRKISFFISENSEKSYLHSSLWQEREYEKPRREGAEQGGHCFFPEVKVFRSLREFLAPGRSDCQVKICFELADSGQKVPELPGPISGLSHLLAIGPERGWTAQELELLEANGFQLTALGDTILRTETACTAAVSVVCAANNYFRRRS